MTPDDLATLDKIYVPHSSLLSILDAQSDKFFLKLDPTLQNINKNMATQKEICEKRASICPALNIDAKTEIARKRLDAKTLLERREVEANIELEGIKRDAEQAKKKDWAQFWSDYGKTVVVGIGVVAVTVITTAVTVIVAFKGLF